MEHQFQFSDAAPYPPVQVSKKNTMYAKAMLFNMGSCSSEMSTVSNYFYNSIVLKDEFEETAECFHKISVVEMHHLDIFGQLAFLSGGDPRLWNCSGRRPVYWSPGCNTYSRTLSAILRNAIEGEKKAITHYQKQVQWIDDPFIVENLKRIILDEEHHINIFYQLHQELCT